MTSRERVFYVNGKFVSEKDAVVPIMDRGYLFADGIYEVSAVVGGRTIDNVGHLQRLERSLAAIEIANPYSMDAWIELQNAMIRKNALEEGLVYIQVTRGVAERDFGYDAGLDPMVTMFTQPRPVVNVPQYATGIHVATVTDQRWARRDIKSLMLLAQVMAKREAVKRGAHDAWLVEDGFVTEGASSSAFIVTRSNCIVTRPLSNTILPSITRASVLRVCRDHGLTLQERPFTVEEALAASEAFVTAAASVALPVTKIDGHVIGTGLPGPVSSRLRRAYFDLVGVAQ